MLLLLQLPKCEYLSKVLIFFLIMKLLVLLLESDDSWGFLEFQQWDCFRSGKSERGEVPDRSYGEDEDNT